MIDLEKEVGKLESKKETLGKQLKKLQDAAAVPTYHTKVPEDVRNQNTEKVTNSVIYSDAWDGYRLVVQPGIHCRNEDSHGIENRKSQNKIIFRGEKNRQAYFIFYEN